MYLKIVENKPSGFPITQENLAQIYPNAFQDETLEISLLKLGFAKLVVNDKPSVLFPLIADNQVEFNGSQVISSWTIRPMSVEEQNAAILEKRKNCDDIRENCLNCNTNKQE